MVSYDAGSLYGDAPSNWRICTLKDVCLSRDGILTGPFGSQLHQRDYKTLGTPIITVEHLGENCIIHEDLPRVSDDDRRRLSRYSLQTGDIVFSRVGSVDRRALVRETEEGWLFSGRCLRVRPDPDIADSAFLSWVFGLPVFKEYIRQIAVGATMPSLNTRILSDVEIVLPPLPEQKAIAGILNSMTDKILLNNEINITLEQIGQTVFKRWFVDFEFPNEEGKPYKSSGGAMSDSELGRIPEKWSVKKIGDVLELAYGRALKDNIRQPGIIPVYGSNGQIGWHDEWLAKGPGIIVGRKGNPGTVIWSNGDFFAIDTTFYVVAKDALKSLFYIFYALQRQNLPSLSADSAVPGLNRNMVYANNIPVPSSEVVSQFDSIIAGIRNSVQNNSKQNLTLSLIRDTLLPKLMSGKIKVPVQKGNERRSDV